VVRLPLLLVAGAATAVTLAGCGAQAYGTGLLPVTSPLPELPVPVTPGLLDLGSAANSAGWTAAVTADSAGQLQLTVTVTGPLTVLGGCVQTLSAVAETTAGVPVPTPTLSPAMECMAIALEEIPAGATRSFTASLPDPPQPGTYVIVGSLRTEGTASPGVPPVTITT
jgi:hypothetical protein